MRPPGKLKRHNVCFSLGHSAVKAIGADSESVTWVPNLDESRLDP